MLLHEHYSCVSFKERSSIFIFQENSHKKPSSSYMKYALFFRKETIETNIYVPGNTSLAISVMHVMHNHFPRNLENS